MPFPNPPIPESFDVGLITGGHAHFDQNGVTFYDTDGVTQVLHMDFATGLLTIGPPTGKRLVINATSATPLEFFSNNAGATTPAEIFSQQNSASDTWFYMQGENYGSAQGPPWFGIHTGSGGTYFSWGMDQGNGYSMKYVGSSLELDPGANLATYLHVARGTDSTIVNVPGCFNGAVNRQDCGTQTANIKDASGDVDYTHACGQTPNSVVWLSGDSSAWMYKLASTSTAGFTMQIRNNAGAFPPSGTGITGRYSVWA